MRVGPLAARCAASQKEPVQLGCTNVTWCDLGASHVGVPPERRSPVSMTTYSYKRSYAHDPTLKGKLFALLETCFPGITQAERASLALGWPWESVSTPFVSFQEDLAIAHVGLIDMPLVVMGQTRHVGGIHAVGTRPAYRRRGHYRQVMTEVLRYCAHRYDTLMLATGQPALYEPFGFRVLQEYLFVCMVTPPRPGAPRASGLSTPRHRLILSCSAGCSPRVRLSRRCWASSRGKGCSVSTAGVCRSLTPLIWMWWCPMRSTARGCTCSTL